MEHLPTYKTFGDSAILVEWPAEMNEFILKDVILFHQKIQQIDHENITETIQSINSITVIYNRQLISFKELKLCLEKLYLENSDNLISSTSHLWKIPMCYDAQFGLDLEVVSHKSGLSIDGVIGLHSDTIYQIYSIGFLPGFLYLGGLDKKLHIARKSNPRLKVLKGAVGIGGKQTGIYPTASPGGWQIIGNTPSPLFNINKDIPCFAKPGDKIQFIPISLDEYKKLTTLTLSDSYSVEKEVVRD